MTTYKDAGVDIELKKKALEHVKEMVKSTFTGLSVSSSTMFKFGGGIDLSVLKEKQPVLILSADGVGTKMMIAEMAEKYDTVGVDLVHHCVNDILTSGAKPIFFLDYIAASKLKPEVLLEIVSGVSNACRSLGIALAGGETAEMPDVYYEGRYELAGVIGGIVEKENTIDTSKISEGDVLIGLPSSGLHTNGYSLARKILFKDNTYKVSDYVEELGETIGSALLKPHREYASLLIPMIDKKLVTGLAHITGGSFQKNISRIMPSGLGVNIKKNWDVPPIFSLLEKLGKVPKGDMLHTFNMGIGMVVIASKKNAPLIVKLLGEKNEKCWVIGKVVKGDGINVVC
jgi:phosphoribosylformylglycinamidine cyclo-ligase